VLMEATADLEQSMRSAISAIDRSVVDKSALIFSIVSGERCIPLRGIRTILDAIAHLDCALPRDQGILPMTPPGACHRIRGVTTVGEETAHQLYPVDIEFRQSRHRYGHSSTASEIGLH
jgi:hypothetical protein